jgi:hypothetical protein
MATHREGPRSDENSQWKMRMVRSFFLSQLSGLLSGVESDPLPLAFAEPATCWHGPSGRTCFSISSFV